MITTFKVILLIAIVVTLIGAVAEEDKNIRTTMLIINMYSTIIFFGLLVLI